jgi:hypothetical protein
VNLPRETHRIQWHLRRRESSDQSIQPHPAPSGAVAQQSENFQRFYRYARVSQVMERLLTRIIEQLSLQPTFASRLADASSRILEPFPHLPLSGTRSNSPLSNNPSPTVLYNTPDPLQLASHHCSLVASCIIQQWLLKALLPLGTYSQFSTFAFASHI